jgi:hypothetical protein
MVMDKQYERGGSIKQANGEVFLAGIGRDWVFVSVMVVLACLMLGI